MVMNERSIVVVSYAEDILSNILMTMLHAQSTQVLHISPGALGSRQVTVQDDVLRIDGRHICAVVFRAAPESALSEDFRLSDQSFCDAESRAIWLAALNLDSVLAINKYDAMSWFEGIGWPVWRRKLIQAHVPVSKFLFGDAASQASYFWHPYTSYEARPAPGQPTTRVLGSALSETRSTCESLMVGNEIVEGKQTHSVCAAAKLLTGMGIWLAAIVTDQDDGIVSVNTLPTINDYHIGALVAQRIAETYYAHLHCG